MLVFFILIIIIYINIVIIYFNTYFYYILTTILTVTTFAILIIIRVSSIRTKLEFLSKLGWIYLIHFVSTFLIILIITIYL